MAGEYWCDSCCSPVEAGDVIFDFSAEGDGHYIRADSHDDEDEVRELYFGEEGQIVHVCQGPVRRVG